MKKQNISGLNIIKQKLFSCLTEVYSSDTISNPVQWRRPAHHSHHIGDHQQNCTGYSWFCRQAHLWDENERLNVPFVLGNEITAIFVVTQWSACSITSCCYSHEKPSGRRSHTCHRSAWGSGCFAQPQYSGHARL